MRARTRRWAILALAMAIASLALPASAATVKDPPRAIGPLDLKELTANKHDAGAPLYVTIVTWETWPSRTLDISGQNRMFVHFNTDHSGGQEYVGEVLFRDGALFMRIETAGGVFVSRLPAYHPEGDVLKITIPKGLPNPEGHAWIAASERWVTASGPCAEPCHDRVPDRERWLKVTPGL